MKIKDERGLILESHNELVIEQWKKRGYEDLTEETKPAQTEKPKRKRKSAE